jgi:hypothetical protein
LNGEEEEKNTRAFYVRDLLNKITFPTEVENAPDYAEIK